MPFKSTNMTFFIVATATCFLSSPMTLMAAEPEAIAQRDITVIHTVKSGENLHSITRSYLGTDILWQDNWQLNPHIKNPAQLKIGEQLTIIAERIIPAEKAKVLNVVNRVEKKLTEGAWASAVNGDVLVQQEGVRTYEKSSALLEFNQASTLKVLEFSQIFLQSRSTGLRGTDSATIEVVKGDAELSWEPIKNQQTEITIVSGSTISKPETKNGQATALRTGVTDTGKSVISVYQGNSSVASAGSQVSVKEGMGVAVKPGEAPPAPQPLLKAPRIIGDKTFEYSYTNPVLMWQKTPKAASYLIEICADADCQQVLKQQSVTQAQWQINDFNQKGHFYFRLAAVSEDDLVGYRTAPEPLTFSTDQQDLSPPVLAIEITGKKSQKNDTITIGPDAQLMIFAADKDSGVASIKYRWGMSDWQHYTQKPILLNTQENTLNIQATDTLGLKSNHSYTFTSK